MFLIAGLIESLAHSYKIFAWQASSIPITYRDSLDFGDGGIVDRDYNYLKFV